jgi:hypothetical protein
MLLPVTVTVGVTCTLSSFVNFEIVCRLPNPVDNVFRFWTSSAFA